MLDGVCFELGLFWAGWFGTVLFFSLHQHGMETDRNTDTMKRFPFPSSLGSRMAELPCTLFNLPSLSFSRNDYLQVTLTPPRVGENYLNLPLPLRSRGSGVFRRAGPKAGGSKSGREQTRAGPKAGGTKSERDQSRRDPKRTGPKAGGTKVGGTKSGGTAGPRAGDQKDAQGSSSSLRVRLTRVWARGGFVDAVLGIF